MIDRNAEMGVFKDLFDVILKKFEMEFRKVTISIFCIAYNYSVIHDRV